MTNDVQKVLARPIINAKFVQSIAEAVMEAIALEPLITASKQGEQLYDKVAFQLLYLVREDLISREAIECYVSEQYGARGLDKMDKFFLDNSKNLNEFIKKNGGYHEVAPDANKKG